MKRLLSILLLLIMVVGVVAACDRGNDNPGTVTTGDGTQADTTGDGRYHANVPAKDYDGATFIILCKSRTAAWGEWGIASDGADGSTLNDAVYDRNMRVVDDYGINLKINEINDETSSNSFLRAMIAQNAMAGDYIADICIAGMIDVCNLIPQNAFVNLESVPHIDLDGPWWQQRLNESIRILNKQYFAINDMLLNDKRDTYLLYFNKTNFDNYQMEYPYQMVYDGTWTNDKLLDYVKGYSADLNGNNIVDTEDRIAYTYYLNDTFFVGGGITGAALDEDGVPYIVEFTEKHADIYEDIRLLLNQTPFNAFSVRTNGNNSALFQEAFDDEGLFMSFHMAHMMEVAQNYESVVGIVPQPKYDEQQTNYYSRAGFNGATAITILTSTPDLDRAGLLTEVFAAESKNYISPAFYETLFTTRYTSDDESKDMLDIVIKSEIIDLDQVFQWGHLIMNAANAADANNTSISSLYTKYVRAAGLKLEKTLDIYAELDNYN